MGYLVYATYTRYRHDEHPAGIPAVTLAVATQVPDVIDNPLAYEVGVLPQGRALAHSLLVAVPLCALGLGLGLAWRAGGWRARSGAAFAIGYATHLFGDAFPGLLALELDELAFLARPLLSPPDYDAATFAYHLDQFLESAGNLDLASPFVAEWLLFALAVGLWLSHRSPPFPAVLAALRWPGEVPGDE